MHEEKGKITRVNAWNCGWASGGDLIPRVARISNVGWFRAKPTPLCARGSYVYRGTNFPSQHQRSRASSASSRISSADSRAASVRPSRAVVGGEGAAQRRKFSISTWRVSVWSRRFDSVLPDSRFRPNLLSDICISDFAPLSSNLSR